MNDKIDTLLGQIRRLEGQMIGETRRKEAEFCHKIHAQRVEFTDEVRKAHQKFKVRTFPYVLHSRFLVLLTTPVIWMCVLPILFTDLIGTIYQAICFPIYGIPKVKRSDYLAFDRHHLSYLNTAEKLSCEYCAYVNGILGYFTEIAARTEQHWCPIKHAGCVKCAHSRYKKFIDYGAAEQYRHEIEKIRRSFEDIKSDKHERDDAQVQQQESGQ